MFFQSTLPILREMARGFVHLAYPDLCVACEDALPATGHCFCLKCQLKLAPSDMYKRAENEFTDRFWGRLPLQTGAALYYFTRKSPIQHALHQLKYGNKPGIAVKLGRLFGRQLASMPHFLNVDGIVPVPLHPKKEHLRGYNQSAEFARGLSEGWGGLPFWPHALKRSLDAGTQTNKKRLERFQNVGASFTVSKPSLLQGKHILLVDDVLTTGATLEACGQAILNLPDCKLSLATIAIAI
jgi:ComF family protein